MITVDNAPYHSSSTNAPPSIRVITWVSIRPQIALITASKLSRSVDQPQKGNTDNQDVGEQGPLAKLPGNNPHAADYKETATFNSGTPAKAAVASVLATDIRYVDHLELYHG